jgi:prolipoprotein diacylglyceryltransferase
MFSPIYFLNNWTGGMTYHDAVLAAFNGEIEKLKSYQSILPIITSLLTPDVIAGSTQEFGGTDSLWLWKTQLGEFQ